MNARTLARALHETNGERLEQHQRESLKSGAVLHEPPFKAGAFDALPASSRDDLVRDAEAALVRYAELTAAEE